MARFCTLYSGSSGNSTYIGTGTGGILVDAGVSCKALLTALSARDIRPDTIRGLFLTHEHIDHIKGVRVLLKKYAIPLFASRETLEWLADRGELPSTGPVQEISASTVIADPALCHQPRFAVQLRLCGEPARWAQDLGSHRPGLCER